MDMMPINGIAIYGVLGCVLGVIRPWDSRRVAKRDGDPHVSELNGWYTHLVGPVWRGPRTVRCRIPGISTPSPVPVFTDL